MIGPCVANLSVYQNKGEQIGSWNPQVEMEISMYDVWYKTPLKSLGYPHQLHQPLTLTFPTFWTKK